MSTAALGAASGAGKSLAELRRAGKQVARDAGGGTVSAFFQANKDTLKALLPAHMTPERMMKIALGALRTTPKLMDCTVESLFGAVVVCSQMGLEPNTPQGHIYLIPFENRRKKTTEVQIVVGYKGLIDLARRSGQIESISARVVYQNDECEIDYGTADRIVHKPYLGGDRGPVIGFYAVAKLKGGGVQFEFMSAAEVNAVRDGSQGYQTAKRFNNDKSPWISNYEEMGRKTLIRRLAKYLPMSIELANAVALDGRAEVGDAQGLDRVLDGDFTVVDGGEEHEGEAGADTAQENNAGAGSEGEAQSQPEGQAPADDLGEWAEEVADLISAGQSETTATSFANYCADQSKRVNDLPPAARAKWDAFATERREALKPKAVK